MSDAGSNVHKEIDRIKSEHCALSILRFLRRETAYRTNESRLADYPDLIALGGDRANLRTAVATLESSGLVATDIRSGLLIFSLTQRGEEVALGHLIADGVLRPRAEEQY